MTEQVPSTVEVGEIVLHNFDGSKKLGITHLVNRVDIFESMNQHTLTADFHLTEGIELINNFPILGEEEISVTIKTPGRKEINYKFFVESVVDHMVNTQGSMRKYILRCVTKDYLMNSFKMLTQRYTDLQYHEAIENVLVNDLQTMKSAYIETTTGWFDYMCNNKRPFQIIDIINERAVSKKYASSVFFFYEDNNGYNFTTFEGLIDRKSKQIGDKVFNYDAANLTDVKSNNSRNILQYKMQNTGDSIAKIRSGGLRNRYRQFDIFYGDYWESWEYFNPTDYTVFVKTDKPNDVNSSKFQNFVTSKPAQRKLVVTDGSRLPQLHNNTLPIMGPYKNKINQHVLKMRIYGDTSITVGDVIKLNIPNVTGTTAPKEQQRLYSENYIIKELKHRIEIMNTGRWEHYMNLDCRKTNLYGAV